MGPVHAVTRIYVHPGSGKDSHKGLQANAPKRTIDAALKSIPAGALRDGYEILLAEGNYAATGGQGIAGSQNYLERPMSEFGKDFQITFRGMRPDFSAPAAIDKVVLDFASSAVLVMVKGGRYALQDLQIGNQSRHGQTQLGVSALGFDSEVTLRNVRIRTTSQTAGSIDAEDGAVINLAGTVEINEDLHSAPDGAGENTFAGISASYSAIIRTIEKGTRISIGNGTFSVGYYGTVQVQDSEAIITSWTTSNCFAANNSGHIDVSRSTVTLKQRISRNTQIGPEDDGHIIADGAVINLANDDFSNTICLQKGSTLKGGTVRVTDRGKGIVYAMSGSRLAATLEGDWKTLNATTGARLMIAPMSPTPTVETTRSGSVDFVPASKFPATLPFVHAYLRPLNPTPVPAKMPRLPDSGGGPYYVSDRQGSDSNPGTSPDKPFKTVKKALLSIPAVFSSRVRVQVEAGSYDMEGAVLQRSSQATASTQAVGVFFEGKSRNFSSDAERGEVIFVRPASPVIQVTAGDWGFQNIQIGAKGTKDQSCLDLIGTNAVATLNNVQLVSSGQAMSLIAPEGARANLEYNLWINPAEKGIKDSIHRGGIFATNHGNVRYRGGGGSLEIGNGILRSTNFGSIQLGWEQVNIQANSRDVAPISIAQTGRIDLHGSTLSLSNINSNAIIHYTGYGRTLAEGAHFRVDTDTTPATIRLEGNSLLSGQDFQLSGNRKNAQVFATENSVFVEGEFSHLSWVRSVSGAYILIEMQDSPSGCPERLELDEDGRTDVYGKGDKANCPVTTRIPGNAPAIPR
ncbi:MAG: hypothetical protein NTW21_00170 [Verrucomicrobia bacterium]|nr:hypothetical protein [Verrucomicrobiota bacterium]